MAEDTHANEKTAFRYDGALARDIETRRQKHWEQENAHHVPNPGEVGFNPDQKKFYCLDMFPYPSGKGLHVGHPLGYIGTDIICRFHGSVMPKCIIEIFVATSMGVLNAALLRENDVWSPMGHQLVGVLLAFLVVFRSQIAWTAPLADQTQTQPLARLCS